jgi:hypothetical protein
MHVLSWPAAGQILKNPAIQVYKTNEINYIQEARNRSVQRLWGYLVMGSGRRSLTRLTTELLNQQRFIGFLECNLSHPLRKTIMVVVEEC